MEKKLSEEILQIIKYPVCAINDCTVCKEKCDQILTAVKAYTEYVIRGDGSKKYFTHQEVEQRQRAEKAL